jgi:hypothetical protein
MLLVCPLPYGRGSVAKQNRHASSMRTDVAFAGWRMNK